MGILVGVSPRGKGSGRWDVGDGGIVNMCFREGRG